MQALITTKIAFAKAGLCDMPTQQEIAEAFLGIALHEMALGASGINASRRSHAWQTKGNWAAHETWDADKVARQTVMRNGKRDFPPVDEYDMFCFADTVNEKGESVDSHATHVIFEMYENSDVGATLIDRLKINIDHNNQYFIESTVKGHIFGNTVRTDADDLRNFFGEWLAKVFPENFRALVKSGHHIDNALETLNRRAVPLNAPRLSTGFAG